MRICGGCGGVLGRDCFNEFECTQIGRSLDFYAQFDPVIELLKERQQLILNETNVDVKDIMIKELLKGIDPDYNSKSPDLITSFAVDDLPF